jgi:hypothetical protein
MKNAITQAALVVIAVSLATLAGVSAAEYWGGAKERARVDWARTRIWETCGRQPGAFNQAGCYLVRAK